MSDESVLPGKTVTVVDLFFHLLTLCFGAATGVIEVAETDNLSYSTLNFDGSSDACTSQRTRFVMENIAAQLQHCRQCKTPAFLFSFGLDPGGLQNEPGFVNT